MNNRVAIWLGIVIVGLLVFDMRANDGAYIVFWAKQGLRLIDWMAFWR